MVNMRNNVFRVHGRWNEIFKYNKTERHNNINGYNASRNDCRM